MIDPASSRASRYVELHARSAFSFRRAGSSVEALVARAAELGMPALALTDSMTLAGVVRFQAACAKHGVRPIVGAELAVADPQFGDAAQPAQLVALVQNATGYTHLCQLLTTANLARPEAPIIPLAELVAYQEGLLLLTGGAEGTLARLVLAGRTTQAQAVATRYRQVFGPTRIFVELQQHRLPESIALQRRLVELADDAGLGVVATNGVCYAAPEDYPLYDLLTCVRLGLSVETPHSERPRNDEAFLCGGDELATRFAGLPWGPEALAAAVRLAASCKAPNLLQAVCRAPQLPLPEGETPDSVLRQRCAEGMRNRYADVNPAALCAKSPQQHQLAHELIVIAHMELAEFFLCVADIVRQARAMGIRCSGRGSAANSLVAYVLGITGVDPLAHGLLFERFLNPERRGMPDIDIDVQSDRREELIRYVERTYTHAHAAMVANVITYRPRLALRDAAKALGFPLPLVHQMTAVLPHHCGQEAMTSYLAEVEGAVRRWGTAGEGMARADTREAGANHTVRTHCLARLPLLFALAPRLVGLPRHLSLHNGGIVLTREPLARLLPVRVSANGVRALEVDKDDVETCGLIKFDLLGLRTLGAIEECLALLEETTGQRPAVDALPVAPPDPATMRLVRAGQTLAVFQIESPGQWHLLAQTQPRTFHDLIIQTALFRPGPIQGGFVRPYVLRRQAERQAHQQQHGERQSEWQDEHASQRSPRQHVAVQTPWQGKPADAFWTRHPVLGPLLAESQGILLFQEQILLIAHTYAGLSYAEADGFRRAMSHARTPAEMAAMRARFLAGAGARGEPVEEAERVFGAISQFVGYGFCKSHAAEFARTIYQTAWLKAHYPAHYLAAFLSSQPAGFFPAHVVLEEAKHLGIPVLPVSVQYSENRFSVERVGSDRARRWAIRIGLGQVAHVGEALARAILWARRDPVDGAPGPFRSLADFCVRLRPHGLTWEAAEALVLAGACASLHPGLERRRLLWHLHELWPLVSGTRSPTLRRRRQRGQQATRDTETEHVEQLTLDWPLGGEVPPDVPALPAITRQERVTLDYALLGMSARPHPLALRRRELRRRGIVPIADLARLPAGGTVRVAGWPISAQRPPTAKGMGFLVLEDETGRLPVALPPRLAERMHRVVRQSQVVVVTGRVERIRWYHAVLGQDIRAVS
jgi:error-prone DNA polymerase